MNTTPCERKQIIKVSRKCPDRRVLAPDGQWAVVDSSESVNGMDVKSHALGFDRLLQHATKRKRCIAATGGEMLIESEIELCCELDGHQMAVMFADLPVQCPILSVRCIIRKGNDIVFTEDGGYIQHRTSRRKIDLVEREGVYFIKMKILDGVNSPDDAINKSTPFAGQGR